MRKILCGILAFIISCFSIISYAEDYDLQTEKEKLQDQINQSTENLTDVQNELSENLQQVQKLDEKISSSQEEVAKLDGQIDELQSSIDGVKKELNIAENKYNTQEDTLEKRLVAMYEAGETEYLDVILSSKSISDFLSNYFLVTEMAQYDISLLDEMAQRRDEINVTKQQLLKDLERVIQLNYQNKKKKYNYK